MDQTIIITAAFFSSIVSGLTGMGGGFLLLAFLAAYFPPFTLIPLHGCLQLISNLSRGALFFQHINWRIVAFFSLGAAGGAVLGAGAIVSLPKDNFRVILALAILAMTWAPKLKNVPQIRGLFVYLGFGATFLSICVGSVGPLTAPFFLKAGLIKETLVGSKAACQIPLHLFKIFAYLSAGFLVSPWLSALAASVPAMFLGVFIGKSLLKKISPQKFYILLQIIITFLALYLLLKGLGLNIRPG